MTISLVLPRPSHVARFSPCQRGVRCSSSNDLSSHLQRFVTSNSSWGKYSRTLFLSGAVTGPLLDSIHSRTQLQVYDSLPIDLTAFHLDFHSSLWICPLLGAFYLILGTLHPLADFLTETSKPKPKWGFIALNFGVLALGIEISAWMYEHGWNYSTIHLTLAPFALLNWAIFERTRHGLLLALICAAGAPLAEMPILIWLKWWHYPQPDLFGLLPSWVFWCYFFYTPAVGNLARRLM